MAFNKRARSDQNSDAAPDAQAPDIAAQNLTESSLPQAAPRYRNLDVERVVETLDRLVRRIDERFPGSGLASVCRELKEVATQTRCKVELVKSPIVSLRAGVGLVVLISVIGLIFIGWQMATLELGVGATEVSPHGLTEIANEFAREKIANAPRQNFAAITRVTETVIHIITVIAAAFIFLFSIENRMKRRRILRDLHELRSITHVIDMHQLTKDPGLIREGERTTLIARRPMSHFELIRYFDYCSEMFSLTSKLAAIYAQYFPDPIIISAVNDIEGLTTNLSRKVWQKISILESFNPAANTHKKPSAL